MSVNFTVRVPRKLYERMKRHSEVNWSEVVRRAIEEYLEKLEGSDLAVPSEMVIEELLKMGVSPSSLRPLSPEEEEKLYRELRERTWERIRSTIQA
uniref:Ribbon-helix-helix domain-containing protein n=1 Tax=Ignisphaera aggregans TaxID=334771 RepID=A0A7J3Z692_9CREN